MKKLIALILALVVCLWWYTSTKQDADGLVPTVRVSREAPKTPHNLPVRDVAVESDARAVVPESEVSPVEEPAETITVSASCADEAGAPLEGIELVIQSIPGEPSALSNSDGDVNLVLLASDVRNIRPQVAVFYLKSRRTVAVRKQMGLSHTEDTFLGHFTLLPGGTIEGQVLDWVGAPAVGAMVHCSEPVLDRNSDDYLRRRILGDWPPLSVVTETKADGRYVIEGVDPSTYAVSAYMSGTLRSISEPVAVRPLEVARPETLILERLPVDSMIKGVVLNGDGSPQVDAMVISNSTDGHRHFGRTRTDDEGAFTLGAQSGTNHMIRAGRPGHDPLHAYDVEAGTHDLVLQSVDRGKFTIRAETPDKQSVSSFGVNLVFSNGHHVPGGWGTSKDGSPIRVSIPQAEFTVSVATGKHAMVELGPYDPLDLPETITAVMKPLPLLTGQVLADGVPVAGARVEAFYSRDSYVERLANGLHRIRMYQQPRTTFADEEGRFELVTSAELRMKNGHKRLHLRATGNSYAFGPELVMDLVEAASNPDVVLLAMQPGAMEGHIQGIADRDIRGLSISISRADNEILTERIDAAGAYHFAGLAPGQWQAALVSQAQSEGEARRPVGGARVEDIVWSFEVFEGETTQFNIPHDGRLTDSVKLHGTFLVNGSVPLGWSWRALRDGAEIANGRLDSDGGFEMACDMPGDVLLGFVAPLPGNAGNTTLLAELSLRTGPNEWAYDLTTAKVTLMGLAEPLEDYDAMHHRAAQDAWALEWEDENRGLRWWARPLCGPPSGLEIPLAPVGKVTLTNYKWHRPVAETAQVLELSAGGSISVTVGE